MVLRETTKFPMLVAMVAVPQFYKTKWTGDRFSYADRNESHRSHTKSDKKDKF
jgi:hypothetical protein